MFFDNRNEPKAVIDANGIATIKISGPISHNPSWWGGTSHKEISELLEAALASDEVKAIVLSFDSPGGECYGIHELAEQIFAARSAKPIVSHVTRQACSAAMHLALAASAVYVESDSSTLGSLGVYSMHYDISKMLDKEGVKITEVSAGEDKMMLSENNPLSDKGKAFLQERVDHFYSLMRSDIARFRGVTEEAAQAKFMDAKVFSGGQAVSIGLADAILNRAELTALITSSLKGEGGSMELKELASAIKSAFVDGGKELKASAFDEGNALGYAEGIEAGKAQGKAAADAESAAKERERIKGVMALCARFPQHKEQIEAAAFGSAALPGEVALQLINSDSEREQKAKAEVMAAPDVAPVPGTGANADPVATGRGDAREEAKALYEAAKALVDTQPDLTIKDAIKQLSGI
jgi:signal peptide peptidase SppA